MQVIGLTIVEKTVYDHHAHLSLEESNWVVVT